MSTALQPRTHDSTALKAPLAFDESQLIPYEKLLDQLNPYVQEKFRELWAPAETGELP